MQSFQGSGFSVELPDDAIDASSYCFTFPNAGDYAPNLTIRIERPQDEPDLKAYVAAQRAVIEVTVESFSLINEINGKKDFWTYVISIVEWGPDDTRIRQKQAYIYVPGESPKLYMLTGTDLAANFEQSDAIFNQVIKSFTPNDIQVF